MNDFDPTTLNAVVKGRLNVDDVIKRYQRVRRSVTKRDTVEHVTKIMENIEEELDGLKVTRTIRDNSSCTTDENERFPFVQQETENRRSENERSPSSKCLVSPEGDVNCTEAVYQDPTEWRTSRRQIEQQIREMRMQLETLKVNRHEHRQKFPRAKQLAETEQSFSRFLVVLSRELERQRGRFRHNRAEHSVNAK